MPESDPSRSPAARLAGNATALTIVPLLARLSGIVPIILIAQRYGERDLGLYRFALVLIGYFLEAARLGLGPRLVREMAARPAEASLVYHEALAARLTASLASWLVLAAILMGLAFDPVTQLVVGILAIALIFQIIADTNNQVFIASEQAGMTLLIESLGAGSFLILSVAALSMNAGIPGVATARLISAGLQAVVGWVFIGWRVFPVGRIRRPILSFSLLREGWPFAAIAFTSYVISETDVFILKQMTSLELLGLYASAQTIVSALKSAVAGQGMASAPGLSHLYADGRYADVRDFGHQALYVTAWFSFFCVALLVPLASPIIELVFGAAFLEGALALQVAIWVLPLYGICNILGSGILAADGERSIAQVNAVIALLNVALCVLLIPRMTPLVAVGIAAVLTYAMCAFLYIRLANRYEVIPVSLLELQLRPTIVAIITMLMLGFGLRGLNRTLDSLSTFRAMSWFAIHLIEVAIGSVSGASLYLALMWRLGSRDFLQMLRKPVSAAVMEGL